MSEKDLEKYICQYKLCSYKMRPVKPNDKWCKKTRSKNLKLKGEAPWGYIVEISTTHCCEYLGKIFGVIVRSKKVQGKFLIQVIPNENYSSEYRIVFNSTGVINVQSYKIIF